MPLQKIRLHDPLPKTIDTTWGDTPALDEFNKQAAISPDTNAMFEKSSKPISRLVKGADYLEWEFCPLTTPYGDTVLSLSPNSNTRKMDYQNLTVEFKTSDYRVKEQIILKSKPASNIFKFLINTNLTPDYLGLGNIDAYPDHCLGINWGAVFHWERLKIIDADGNIVYGLYGQQDGKGDIPFIIPQAFLDNAVYPVTIDPSTTQITTAVPQFYFIVQNLGTNICDYNGSVFVSSFGYGSFGTVGKILTWTWTAGGGLADLTDETASSPFAAGTSFRGTAVVHFTDNTFLFIVAENPPTQISCATRDGAAPGAESWGSKVVIKGSYFAEWGFAATVTPDDTVWVLFGRDTVVFDGMELWWSDDKGATWQQASDAGGGELWDGYKTEGTKGQYNLVANDDGILHIVGVTKDPAGTTLKKQHQTYNPATETYSSMEEIGGTVQTGSNHKASITRDSGGFLYYAGEKSSSGWPIRSNKTGSWDDFWTTGYIDGCPPGAIDDANNHFSYSATHTGGEVRINGDAGSEEDWFDGYGGIGVKDTKVTDLATTEPIWFIASDWSTETVFAINTDYNFGAGDGDIFLHKIRQGVQTPLRGGVR
jgi:hypothetical protein